MPFGTMVAPAAPARSGIGPVAPQGNVNRALAYAMPKRPPMAQPMGGAQMGARPMPMPQPAAPVVAPPNVPLSPEQLAAAQQRRAMAGQRLP